ncbi:MAG: hypothetical protein H5T41_11305 [Methanomassiliicoccales archaeon]|nr:hypothetical protein [Methanomassiliicoccales archaeon]
MDFSFEAMEEAKSAVARVYNFLAEAERIPAEVNPADPEFPQFLAKEKERFHAELQDDFNTPGGLAVIQEIISEAYRRNDPGAMRQAAQVVRELGRPLGLFQGEGAPTELGKLSEELLDLVVELRTILRKKKNFALADMIREKLGKLGVELRDGPEGTRWVLRT